MSDVTQPAPPAEARRFSPRCLELAKQLREAGLAWHPAPGQFVYDLDGVLPHRSPFQPGVFFILDLKHFLRYAGSIESLQQRMMWLPSWWDAKQWLVDRGVAVTKIEQRIAAEKAISRDIELEVIYGMMQECLQPDSARG